MESLGEIREERQQREPWRVVQQLLIVMALGVLAYVIVQLVLNSAPFQVRRASRDMDSIAAERGSFVTTEWELNRCGMSMSAPDHLNGNFDGHVYFAPQHLSIWNRVLRGAGLWREPGKIGLLRFESSCVRGWSNYVTGNVH